MVSIGLDDKRFFMIGWAEKEPIFALPGKHSNGERACVDVGQSSCGGVGVERVAEVAMRRSTHEGLSSLHLDAAVIALAEYGVPVAREKMSNVAETHCLVGLSVTTAMNIIIEFRVGRAQDLDL